MAMSEVPSIASTQFGVPTLSPNRAREHFDRQELVSEPVRFDAVQRDLVEQAIHGVVAHKRWLLHAINVRTNHVHVVVTAQHAPEHVMNAFKTWATRRLREASLIGADQRIWSRHGSTIYLFRPENMAEKIRYVNEGQ